MAVRNESVRLTLEDNFTTGMARAAASTAILSRHLKDLDGTHVLGDLDKDAEGAARGLEKTTKSSEGLSKTSKSTSAEIDHLSGRLRLVADTALILGPALIPLGVQAVPAVAGLTAELGAAALAGGTALLAFQGVGDALKAVNSAAIEPTTENLAKAQQALEQLSPPAQEFVSHLEALQPVLRGLEASAAGGLFPGLGDALDQLATAGPGAERILATIGTTLGNLAKQGADALTGDSFAGFFDYIEKEAPVALAQLAGSVGHVTHALAELVQASAPLSRGFGDGLLDAATSFDTFASGVSKTEGFQEFVGYVQDNGPRVAKAVTSIANALLQVVEASSGFGGPVLQAVGDVADVIAKLADSSAGPAIVATASALALLNRAMATAGAVKGSGLVTSLTAAKAAASGAETFGGKLLGVTKVLGPWGLALGVGAGALLAFAHGQQQSAADVSALSATLDKQTGSITANTREFVANQLQQQGVLDAAQRLGLSLKTVTDAALGNTSAQMKVDDATQGLKGTYTGLGYAADLVTKAVGEQSGTVAAARSKTQQLAEATNGAAGSFNQATSAARTFTQQMSSLSDLLQGRASFRDYEASLDDFTKSLKTNGRTLDINTEKGRANQAALDNIAATALKVAESLQGADRADFLVKARKSFLDAARDAGLSAEAAKGLANQIIDLGGVSAKPKVFLDALDADRGLANLHQGVDDLDKARANPKVGVDPGNSFSVLGAVKAAVDRLQDKTIHVTTVNFTQFKSSGNPQAKASADGGSVPKSGLPYADRYHYLLADGEEIISNRHGQADQFRADRSAGRIPGYADGGTTGKPSTTNPQNKAGGRGNILLPDSLVSSLADLGGKLAIETRSLSAQLKALDKTLTKQLTVQEKSLKKAQKAADKTQTALDTATGNRDSLASTIGGTLGLSDIFAKSADISASSNPFAAGAHGVIAGTSDPTSALNKITATSNQFLADIKTLQADGVSGAALQAIIGEGAGVTHQLASGSVADLSAFSQAYGAATSAISAVSTYGGNAVYGQSVSDAKAADDKADQKRDQQLIELRNIKQELRDLKATEKQGHAATAHAAQNSGTKGASNAAKRAHRTKHR